MTAQATPPLGVTELTTILAQLGRSVTGAAGAPPELTAVHLTRVLVAAAEQQAIAAEFAAAKTRHCPPDPATPHHSVSA
ncbi:hypothetical protein N5079_27195 [Planotetraspora sp. A-T 1434]|uniref:hypothetical protein n=1 Tax=Planotetraspora sp. A-T 1434 TaxID=2979219 RepID=UPI0021C00B05|nr:hypothetical protein [Planotetraspora sp. A-T 1434]MCT9933904.1 hypothetical protein [Planotetraspora sp. A-T 1434]